MGSRPVKFRLVLYAAASSCAWSHKAGGELIILQDVIAKLAQVNCGGNLKMVEILL